MISCSFSITGGLPGYCWMQQNLVYAGKIVRREPSGYRPSCRNFYLCGAGALHVLSLDRRDVYFYTAQQTLVR
jgi:hypothetical protein